MRADWRIRSGVRISIGNVHQLLFYAHVLGCDQDFMEQCSLKSTHCKTKVGKPGRKCTFSHDFLLAVCPLLGMLLCLFETCALIKNLPEQTAQLLLAVLRVVLPLSLAHFPDL
jgi:hypothetical protein